MGYVGDPSSWASSFPDQLVGDILDLVLTAWESFPQPQPDDLEVPITQRFCVHMRRQKARSRLPFLIDIESLELDLNTSTLIGRIDLKFIQGFREEVYFALECKRLNVASQAGGRSLSGKYVEEGMMRYITGQYCKNLDKSGMLGYVMDGKVADAIAAVTKAVEDRRRQLKLGDGTALGSSSYRPAATNILESRHSLPNRTFVMQHLFVSVVPPAACSNA